MKGNTDYSKLKFLDCTLRDGGYYNNWDFSENLINKYLDVMSNSLIDIVEIGFRSFRGPSSKGQCAYSDESFLNRLNIPSSLKIAVMVNASDLISHELGPDESIKILFEDSKNSKVDLVRIACHKEEYEKVLSICDWLSSKGYEVGLNLMQIDSYTDKEIKEATKIIKNHKIDVLYFADTFGCLDNESVLKIATSFQSNCDIPLGIHAHDNMGMALSNSLTGINSNLVTWIDSTVTGMGRGPGNTQTEYLLMEMSKISELSKRNAQAESIIPLLKLIREFFTPLQDKYGWGKNPFYYIAGQEKIHPTYIQELLNDEKYVESEIISVIEHLKSIGGRKFSKDAMQIGLQLNQEDPSGSWKPIDLLKSKKILIIGSGSSVQDSKKELESLIKEKDLFVIALNLKSSVPEELINLRIACHPFSLMMDKQKYQSLKVPLVVPESRLNEDIKLSLEEKEVLNFGMKIKSGLFEFYESSCSVPSPLVVAYALGVITSGGSAECYLAGFDGYESGDPRNEEIRNIFTIYLNSDESIPLKSVSESIFNLPLL